ncbi:hypothetical protein LSH36_497g02073, partial [Paralvinella palmiformis]
ISSNEERRKLWLKAINRFDVITRKPWTPSKFGVICSDHFSVDDFILSKHKKLKTLKDTVVPSIFSWTIQHQVAVLLILCCKSCNRMTFRKVLKGSVSADTEKYCIKCDMHRGRDASP